MRGQRFISSIPDELPENLDPEVQLEVEELHVKLRMLVDQNLREKKECFEKYGLVLNTENELSARLTLLIDMFIGVISPERMRLEIRWQEIIAASLEEGKSEYHEIKRQQNGSKNLHLPGGRVHKVAPEKKDESDG